MNLDVFKKEEKVKEDPFMYSEDQLMARLRFFIGVCLALTLTGIVFVVLYSIIFVTQPLNAMSPIDQKFFEMLIPISTFLTGILSGIMLADKGDKEAKMKALEAATRPVPVSPNSLPSQSFGASTFGAASLPTRPLSSPLVNGPLPTPPGASSVPPPPPPVGTGRPPLPPGAINTSGQ